MNMVSHDRRTEHGVELEKIFLCRKEFVSMPRYASQQRSSTSTPDLRKANDARPPVRTLCFCSPNRLKDHRNAISQRPTCTPSPTLITIHPSIHPSIHNPLKSHQHQYPYHHYYYPYPHQTPHYHPPLHAHTYPSR